MLDDNFEFAGKEPDGEGFPSSGGMGLCSEIICDPISDAVTIGDYFPKFGVGLLKKHKAEPYFFMEKYEVRPFPMSWQVNPDMTQVRFVTLPMDCGGYSVLQTKIIGVNENKLTVSYSIKNTGENSILFEEYCHNFLNLNGLLIDEKYQLQLSGISLTDTELFLTSEAPFWFDKTNIGFRYLVTQSSLLEASHDCILSDTAFSWKLINKHAPVTVSENVSFIPERFSLWAASDVISPEIFYKKKLLPGESCCWNRIYTFSIIGQDLVE